jgi:hypothetical protein
MKIGVAALLLAAAATASPVTAHADPAGCLPLNGVQSDAHASETNGLGIFYDIDVTYWYQDGAVNWRRDVNGPFGTHSNGAVPVAPGNTATIPGDFQGSPLLVTICSK